MPHGNNQNMSFIDRELIKKGQGQIVLDKDSYLWKLTKNLTDSTDKTVML